jgi:FkbM family methyltransferase
MLKRVLKRALLKRGYSVRRIGEKGVTGFDPFEDMHSLTPAPTPVIFDVGGNIGQSIQQFRSHFKNPQIHSFEPGEDTFRQLTENTRGLPDVHLVNSGMGSRRETKTFVENEISGMSSFFEPGEDAWGSVKGRRTLQLDTVDDYCNRKGIGHIDILKSDTQGYDLEVLRGASQMLKDKRINLIYLEVIFDNMYQGAPRFDEVYAFLASYGRLVSFYDMNYQSDLLSWADVLFKVAP